MTEQASPSVFELRPVPLPAHITQGIDKASYECDATFPARAFRESFGTRRKVLWRDQHHFTEYPRASRQAENPLLKVSRCSLYAARACSYCRCTCDEADCAACCLDAAFASRCRLPPRIVPTTAPAAAPLPASPAMAPTIAPPAAPLAAPRTRPPWACGACAAACSCAACICAPEGAGGGAASGVIPVCCWTWL